MTWFSPVETTAVVAGLLCVWLTVRQHIACWPAGLVQVVLYIFIFFGARLYSEVVLHVIYVALCIYGWAHWVKGGSEGAMSLPVSVLPLRARLVWGVGVVGFTATAGFSMQHFTDAALPYPDAFVMVASLAAQWMLARKQLESWVLWIAVDVVAITVYLSKALFLTAGLYVVFLFLAIAGLRSWRASLTAVDLNDEDRSDARQVRTPA